MFIGIKVQQTIDERDEILRLPLTNPWSYYDKQQYKRQNI